MPKSVVIGAISALLLVLSCAPGSCQTEWASPIAVEIISPLDGTTYAYGTPIYFCYTWTIETFVSWPVITCTIDGAPSPVWGETRDDLAPGPHVYEVSADMGGGAWSVSSSFTVVAPYVNIEASVVSPEDGMTYPYGTPLAFDYNVSVDGTTEVPAVQTTLDGAPGPDKGAVIADLAPGTHTYSVAASVTGKSASDEVTFTVPNSAGCVTGGGWFSTETSTCSFGLVAMSKPRTNTVRGSLSYVDKAAGVRVKSSAVTALGILGNSAIVQGTCSINREPGHTFSAAVTSVPGGRRKTNTFSIVLDSGYTASGTLKGGCISIHKTE